MENSQTMKIIVQHIRSVALKQYVIKDWGVGKRGVEGGGGEWGGGS